MNIAHFLVNTLCILFDVFFFRFVLLLLFRVLFLKHLMFLVFWVVLGCCCDCGSRLIMSRCPAMVSSTFTFLAGQSALLHCPYAQYVPPKYCSIRWFNAPLLPKQIIREKKKLKEKHRNAHTEAHAHTAVNKVRERRRRYIDGERGIPIPLHTTKRRHRWRRWRYTQQFFRMEAVAATQSQQTKIRICFGFLKFENSQPKNSPKETEESRTAPRRA